MLANSLVQQAQIDVLLFLVRALAERLGVTQIDDLSIMDWFQREKHAQLEAILLHFEDKDPGVAAFLQNLIDGSHRHSGEKLNEDC